MNTEEKAKRYNEIIEKANKMHSENCEACQICIEELIPELAESEDERIRKRLLDFVQGLPDEGLDFHFYNLNKEQVVTWLEKQGQKPADKVEPKFHKGDWVVYECGEETTTLQITRIVGETYVFSDDSTLGVVDEDTLRMWDIAKDAKDGDVLHCWIDGDEFVLIYKGIKDGYITTYCHLYQKLELFSEEPTTMFCGIIQGHFTPTTKEQRDLLFQKMREAGYEWDAEEKELKKIEQKPAWSEEDETTKNNISHIIRQYDKISKRENKPCWYIGDCLLWMQNIKDRVLSQPRREWSEEDENFLDGIIANLKYLMDRANTDTLKQSLQKRIDWLKSLKERYTWKPSDEQIGCLSDAIKHYNSLGYPASKLKELLEDLKKLK